VLPTYPVAPRRRAQLGRLPVGQQDLVAVREIRYAGQHALVAVRGGARQQVVVFIRALRIQRAPLPTSTTETTHLTRGSTAATKTTVAPP
jgi:hypothetical protein